jgi:hypothetical protein
MPKVPKTANDKDRHGDIGIDHVVTRTQWNNLKATLHEAIFGRKILLNDDLGCAHVETWRQWMLGGVIADLNCAVEVCVEQISGKKRGETKAAADWWNDLSRTLAHLIEHLGEIPANLPVELQGEHGALQEHARQASLDAKLRTVENPTNRPRLKGECRDYLARKAKEIIERHSKRNSVECPKGIDLRLAIAAVLKQAGADTGGMTFPDPRKEGKKFRKMFAKPKQALSPEELEARADRLADERF